MEDKYIGQINLTSAKLDCLLKRFHALGFLRLFLLALLAFALYGIRVLGPETWLLAVTGLLLMSTVAAWLHHVKVHGEADLCKEIIAVNEAYIARVRRDWERLDATITGEEYADEGHPYAADLDMTGSKSLFRLLNVAHSWHGRKAFADDLLRPRYTAEEIAQRQEAIRELSSKAEFTNLFQCRTAKIGADPAVLGMIENLQDETDVIRPGLLQKALLAAPPLVSVSFCLTAAFNVRTVYPLTIALLAAQAVFWLAGIRKTSRYLAGVTTSSYIYRHYGAAIELIGREEFSALLLCGIQEILFSGDRPAAKAMEELDGIISKTRVKNSGVLYFLLNVLFLWDYRCAVRLSRWKEKYGGHCEVWFQALGSFESLLSLAGISSICGGVSFPAIEKDERIIEATALGHPLLPNGGRVCNNVLMKDDIHIISGSNMSGKTTFLRTVGVNLVLAASGAQVCAASMRCAMFRIMSSMRIADDLNGGISTFYAELRLVKGIIDAARTRSDLFFLIDEIFRGTNSEDRLFGAKAVITELSALGTMGIATTHDLSLCELEKSCANVRNFSFSEQYAGEDMLFDYVMRPGKSRTTNAKYLMEKIGILRE